MHLLPEGTSTQTNEVAGNAVVCLMTSLTLMLHIVSRAFGNRSAADVVASHRGHTRHPRPTAFGRPAEYPCCCRGSVCRTHQSAPILTTVRDDPYSGPDPELAASTSSAYLCYPVPVLRKEEGRAGKTDDALFLAIWATN